MRQGSGLRRRWRRVRLGPGLRFPGLELSPFNRVNVPPSILASPLYNERPVRLNIEGARETHRRLFSSLEGMNCPRERSEYFQGYMDVAFSLYQWEKQENRTSRLSLKNSYLRFLMGWMYDSNSREGAVLKWWVESRFGIVPMFHRGLIGDPGSINHFRYERDRANGALRTNSIEHQLDLLYEFIQAELHPSGGKETGHLTLYRGIHGFEDHLVVEHYERDKYHLLLNNLNSFTRDFERAWEFGDRVMEVVVPLPKIFFDGALLHSGILQGEEEVLVVGGQYDVNIRWY